MRKFSLAGPSNLSILFCHSASKAGIGLMAKGTVVYQFLSNFNVHMNNVEILIKWICESAFLTSSHDGDAAGQ